MELGHKKGKPNAIIPKRRFCEERKKPHGRACQELFLRTRPKGDDGGPPRSRFDPDPARARRDLSREPRFSHSGRDPRLGRSSHRRMAKLGEISRLLDARRLSALAIAQAQVPPRATRPVRLRSINLPFSKERQPSKQICIREMRQNRNFPSLFYKFCGIIAHRYAQGYSQCSSSNHAV